MYFINFTSLDAEEDTENEDSWVDKKANLEKNFPGKNGLGEIFQSKTSFGGIMSQVSNTYPLMHRCTSAILYLWMLRKILKM
jgi:targeting protein for Xklp2